MAACGDEYLGKLVLKFSFARGLCLCQAQDVVALVLVGQDALDAELLSALLAESLNRLHVGDVLVAVLSDNPELVDQWLVGVKVEQTGLLL